MAQVKMKTTECPLCGPMFIGRCVHGHAEPNEDHRQVMPQTIEAYKKLAQRDLELIEEQREGDTLAAYGIALRCVTINEKGEISAKNIEPESFYVSTIKE